MYIKPQCLPFQPYHALCLHIQPIYAFTFSPMPPYCYLPSHGNPCIISISSHHTSLPLCFRHHLFSACSPDHSHLPPSTSPFYHFYPSSSEYGYICTLNIHEHVYLHIHVHVCLKLSNKQVIRCKHTN